MDGIEEVFSCLGEELRQQLRRLPSEEKRRIREVRLRGGQPVVLTRDTGAAFLLPGGKLTDHCTPRAVCCGEEEVAETFRRACGYSVHSWEEETAKGFLTLPGGNRVGVAGTASLEGGQVRALRKVESLNFRVARSINGAAGELPQKLFSKGTPSVLLAGEPGSGKTSVLRDLVGRLSCGVTGRIFRAAVVDERCELGGCGRLDLGICTDVLSGYPKGAGMTAALRSLGPELLVCDEVGGEEEASALLESVSAGAALLCTAHGDSLAGLWKRPGIRKLLEAGVFDVLVLLGSRRESGRLREILRLCKEGERDENSWDLPAAGSRDTGGDAAFKAALGTGPDPSGDPGASRAVFRGAAL